MDLSTEEFRVQPGENKKLENIDTATTVDIDKVNGEEYLKLLKHDLFELQERLYAENKRSVLIIFQAMDAAGKDSAIKHVMSGLNPQGCQVYSFKQPTSEELDHDFMWRHYKALPERGRIGIHNRSHYENVLVCKVHPKLAANESHREISEINEMFWNSRYKSIRDFEEHLNASGTKILKFFLHISKEEQKKRFLKRIDDKSKNWKFAAGDIAEREQWERYMQAYEEAFHQTSTKASPWYIIPSDKKWFARLAICKVIVDLLNTMNPQYPVLDDTEVELLHQSKKQLLQQ